MANDTLKEIQNMAALKLFKEKQLQDAMNKADAYMGRTVVEEGADAAEKKMRDLAEAAYVRKLKGESLTPNAEAVIKEKYLSRFSPEELSAMKSKYADISTDYGKSKGLKNFLPSMAKEIDKPVKGGMRAATLGSKLGKGLKMIPGIGSMIGLGSALATGDLSAAMPIGFEMDKLGEGSDEVPSEDFVSKEQLKQILDSQRNQNPDEDDINGVKRPSLDKLRQLIDNSK